MTSLRSDETSSARRRETLANDGNGSNHSAQRAIVAASSCTSSSSAATSCVDQSQQVVTQQVVMQRVDPGQPPAVERPALDPRWPDQPSPEQNSHHNPAPAAPLLEINSLRKSFGKFEALRGVTFSLAAGERLAFLGPNGAGKTTLIRCLSGRCLPDGGTITVEGRSISDRGIRDSIGLVPQDIALYGDLTTRENLFAFGRFHGLNRSELKSRVDWALQWTGLDNRANELVGRFSGGMKRRVNLACGVLHKPKILLLDEPTVGVDPQSRHKIFEMLDDLSRRGTAIVLTTHHLDEAQSRSDRIVIMDHGSVVADGTIGNLVAETVGDAKLVRVRLNRFLTDRIVVSNSITVGTIGNDVIETRLNDVSTDLPRLLEAVRRSGREVLDIDVQAPALHHVFLHLTGHGLRDE